MDKENKEPTIEEVTAKAGNASTDFERTNTDLKRTFLIWNIKAFNVIASMVTSSRGSFGTGYPFYALDSNLEGELPVIHEQIRYNRQLVKDGERQKSIWECKSCLQRNYDTMPDLKIICKPCPNMFDKFKPRKIINRLPDIDMWVVCGNGRDKVRKTEKEMGYLLEQVGMRTSDIAPLRSLDEVVEIADQLKGGKFPKIFLPIDAHIIEYSKIKALIDQVPDELNNAKKEGRAPYLPIQPKSLRKEWQYDDEAYNYVYDYLSAFTSFNFPPELEASLMESRRRVANEHSTEELFDMLVSSATDSNKRRFQAPELKKYFEKKIEEWRGVQQDNSTRSSGRSHDDDDDGER